MSFKAYQKEYVKNGDTYYDWGVDQWTLYMFHWDHL